MSIVDGTILSAYAGSGPRSRHNQGMFLKMIQYDSNAVHHTKLTVTPTFSLDGSAVAVAIDNHRPWGTVGKYAFYIKGAEITPFAVNNADLAMLSFNLNLADLAAGDNGCRLIFQYSDGGREYLDFVVTLEDPYRLTSYRIMYMYAGGFALSANAGHLRNSTVGDNFGVNVTGGAGTVTTTDVTSFDLSKDDGITGVNIVGSGGLFLVSFDGRQTWYAFVNSAWAQVDPAGIAASGMTAATLSGVTSLQWAGIFQRTQMDVMAYLSGTDYLRSITLLIPPNHPPYITDVTLTPSSTHEDATLTAHIRDVEGDPAQYRVLINGEVFQGFSGSSSEYDISVIIPITRTIIGTNAIMIETYDGISIRQYTAYLTKVDARPGIIGTLDGTTLTAVLSDADSGDTVRYRILVNGAVKVNWTAFAAPPIDVDYTVPQQDVIVGAQNTVRLEVQDNLGEVTVADFDFVGVSTTRRYAFIM